MIATFMAEGLVKKEGGRELYSLSSENRVLLYTVEDNFLLFRRPTTLNVIIRRNAYQKDGDP